MIISAPEPGDVYFVRYTPCTPRGSPSSYFDARNASMSCVVPSLKMYGTMQVLGAVLTVEAVAEGVRRKVAHSLAQMQTNGNVSALLTALPQDQQSALAALASQAA